MRLTVTLDDESLRDLSTLPDLLAAWKGAVDHALDSSGLEASSVFFEQLARALADLGDDPSASAVIREAVRFFFVSIERAQMLERMERGYEALAGDLEREVAVPSVTRAAAARLEEP